jgi:signal-transduction protein with cAMP-binding, CBS, and nucleotidyltransferase domain
MLVREFMCSPAATCKPEATLQFAAREMERCNVGSLIVVGEDNHLVGIVTDRDLALRAVAWGQDASTPVAEVMTKNVAVILPDADVFESVKKMARWGVRRMPVVDVAGEVAGMIALDDVAAAMNEELELLRRTVSTQMSGGPSWDEAP